jgi:hypothetical protein
VGSPNIVRGLIGGQSKKRCYNFLDSSQGSANAIIGDDASRKQGYNLYSKNKPSAPKMKNNVYRRKCFVRDGCGSDADRLSNSFVFGDSSSGLYNRDAPKDGSVKSKGKGLKGLRASMDCGKIGGGGYLEKSKKVGTLRSEKLEIKKPEKTYKSRLLRFAGSEISIFFWRLKFFSLHFNEWSKYWVG